MTCGIYKITNKINNKVYIGQSKDIEKRWEAHKTSERKRYPDKPLYRAFDKYGLENFKFEIIEECSLDLLNEREIYWIEKFGSYTHGTNHGYNATLGGDGYKTGGGELSTGNIISLEEANKIKKLLEQNQTTRSIVAQVPNANPRIVYTINEGGSWRDENRDYPIKKRTDNNKLSDDIVLEIRKKYSNGATIKDLLEEYKESYELISNIVNGLTYSYLPVFQRKVSYMRKNSNRALSAEDVLKAREQIAEGKSMLSLWKKEYKEKCGYAAFRNMIRGVTYRDIPKAVCL